MNEYLLFHNSCVTNTANLYKGIICSEWQFEKFNLNVAALENKFSDTRTKITDDI